MLKVPVALDIYFPVELFDVKNCNSPEPPQNY